jgi:hypothetical protein
LDAPRYGDTVSLRRPFGAILSAAILVIAALAYATDVDPAWGGLYDDDDGDNVILYITVTMAGVEPMALTRIDHPPMIVVGSVAEREPSEPIRIVLSLPDSRSPPSL